MVTATRAAKLIDTPLDPKAIKVGDAVLSLKVDEESGEVVDTKIIVDVLPDDEMVQQATDSALREAGIRR